MPSLCRCIWKIFGILGGGEMDRFQGDGPEEVNPFARGLPFGVDCPFDDERGKKTISGSVVRLSRWMHGPIGDNGGA